MRAEFLDSLPAELAERSRQIVPADAKSRVPTTANPSGKFVLYWMRTAIRTDENPALDTAISIANALKLPLAVYQGLTERYPFASDRHHTFILQSARDVQVSFAERQIPYWMHVERSGQRGPHLLTLGQQAAVLVTEDMPTEPIRTWTERLSQNLRAPLVAVDTACIVPMQLVGKAYERAFEYRRATKKLYQTRIRKEFSSPHLERREVSIEFPFESLDLQSKSIADLVGECEIDHLVGPVPHSPGGSLAGYRRWDRFKESGLSKYAGQRNTPTVDGVSRLSPYFHYGVISPMRVARETASLQGSGPEKFLDELLIWRELAYAFCFYRRDHDSIAAIPAWAKQTLRDHEGDLRTPTSWETMARGQTDDALWNLAQQSLLIHGELHNNLRMTWGKAVLDWTPNAVRALERLIDLNHRYALDGRDPASYGGILWCLGQFDRPFQPARKILGTVRGRTTAEHAKRLDFGAYKRKVQRPLWKGPPRIAVVGAGLSGLTCARTLADHGFRVRVFEKSHRPGGRMSTRSPDEHLQYDHGTPLFRVTDPTFQRYVDSWESDGLVEKWNPRRMAASDENAKADSSSTVHYVGLPNMEAICRHLAADLDVSFNTRISGLALAKSGWTIECDANLGVDPFDFAISALPAPQTATMQGISASIREQASQSEMHSIWTLMLAFENPLNTEYELFENQSGPLERVINGRRSEKRTNLSDCWIAYANPEWTMANLESEHPRVEEQLQQAFWNAIEHPPRTPIYSAVKLWRYATPRAPSDYGCLIDKENNLGACGDWCHEPSVQGAFLSGAAMAGRIMGHFSEQAPAVEEIATQLALF